MNINAKENAKRRWDNIAKPLASLGLLEAAVIQIAGIVGTDRPDLSKKALVIMCSDNGVVAEGVTQSGQDITAVVTENFTTGNSCVCIMAEKAGVDVIPVDIGVATDFQQTGAKYPLRHSKIRYGTENILVKPAMTKEEAIQAVNLGISLVKELKEKGYGIVALGEMGIGNTTTSSAVAAVLLSISPEQLTGRGAGLSDHGLKHKVSVIQRAITLHHPDPADAMDVIAKVGGLDIAGLVGVCLGAVEYQLPIVLDGFITAAAALAAKHINPAVTDYLLASHSSKEPGGKVILKHLGLEPIIYAQLCLGEGSGAITFLTVLDLAVSVYQQMSSFAENHIEQYQPL